VARLTPPWLAFGFCSSVLLLACAKLSTPKSEADAGNGAEWSVAAGSHAGDCLKRCTDDTQCGRDYRCVGTGQVGSVRLSGACSPKPVTDQLTDDVVGRSCSSDSVCAGGHCLRTSPLGPEFPGSYCSGSCFQDSQCGAGGGCLVLEGSSDAGHCFARCQSDADCTRQGYRCHQVGPGFDACYPAPAQLGDYSAGTACSTDLDCAPGSCASQLPFASLLGDGNVAAPGGRDHNAAERVCIPASNAAVGGD
jgi:hypothetical protein